MKTLNEATKQEIYRQAKIELMRRDFRYYFEEMFFIMVDKKPVIKPFLETIIQAFQDRADGKETKRNLLMNLPVGIGKSLIIEYFISWCFSRSVNHCFLYLSYNGDLIMKLSKETKEIVTHPKWIEFFGGELMTDSHSSTNWRFKGSQLRTGLTAGITGGSITGLDAGNPNLDGKFTGALIIDDPSDAVKTRRYAKYRSECEQFYIGKLKSRRRTPQTSTMMMMQRLHKEDLSNFAEKEDTEEWSVIKMPALDIANETSIWEEKYPYEKTIKMKDSPKEAFTFWAQYQQEPKESGGNVYKSEWWQFYNSISELNLNYIFVTCDTAQKVKEANDYTVFCVWGVGDFINGAGQNLFLLDMLRGKWEAPGLRENAKRIWEKWKGGFGNAFVTSFYIEDKTSGTGLIQDLQNETGIPVIAVPRHKDKLTRVEGTISYVHAGRVYLMLGSRSAELMISECEAFTRDDSHAHDDIVDNLCDGINIGFGIGGLSMLDVTE
jgi:predicted phage terminase large subunit-like protein